LQELFLSAINAGVTAYSYFDHCCETPTRLAIDQREQSLVRYFLDWDQKPGEDDKEFRAGVRPPTIAAKPHALKTNGLNHLVEAVTRKASGTSPDQTRRVHVVLRRAVLQEEAGPTTPYPAYL
uniref:DUF5726 domain-containing protein n=1 Tax=Taenia asiatica TaxID=60517 RepID=A0A0R3W1B0_TAEAS